MKRRAVVGYAFSDTNPKASRRGVAVVMVVACLATFSLLAVTMLRGSLIARGQFRSEQHLRQVELLLDAAVTRAKEKVAAGELLAGEQLKETLVIPATEIPGSADALLTGSATAEGDGWRVAVAASYPHEDSRESPRTVVRRRTFRLPFPASDSGIANDSPNPEETVP